MRVGGQRHVPVIQNTVSTIQKFLVLKLVVHEVTARLYKVDEIYV
jgi:hypothetical protein